MSLQNRMGAIIWRQLVNFAETTTIKGVSRAFKAQSNVVKAIWALAFTACFVVMLTQIVTVIIAFCDRDVITISRNVKTVDPDFPAITMCNLFPVSDFKSLQDKYKEYLRQIQFVRDQASPYLQNYNEVWDCLQGDLSIFNANLPILSETSSNQMNAFVADCNRYGWDLYDGKKCDQKLYLDKFLQLCKTIPSSKNASVILAILFLDTFATQPIYSYYTWTRTPLSTGVTVMIHPQGTKPNPEFAITVPPGTDFRIAVTQTNNTRLPAPYGNCTTRKLIFPDEADSPPYDQATCISLCRQRQFVKACGCLHNYEYFTAAELKMSNNTICLNFTDIFATASPVFIRNNTFTEKFWNFFNCLLVFFPDNNLCDCAVSCSDVQYEVKTYTAQWPNVAYQLGFYDVYLRRDSRYKEKFSAYEKIWNERKNQSGDEILEQLSNMKLIEQNFIQLTVQMRDRSVNMVKEIPAISWSTLGSNFGGTLNLWLGLSIITLAEMLELLYSIGKIAIGAMYNRNHGKLHPILT